MIKKILLWSLASIAAIAVALFAYLQINASPQLFEKSKAGLYQNEPRVVDAGSLRSSQNGPLVGFADNYSTQAWLGISYAQPPLGELRWRAPQPAEPWQGTYQALKYGSPCTQFQGLLAGTDGEDGQLVGSEDCLTLNVWAPSMTVEQAVDKKLPVMFWIHGGGNDSGTANIYQAHHLAGTKEVIVVLINYRVGLMGWLSHDVIRNNAVNQEDASGNFGTLDLIAGLNWVKNNISAFGGDPSNVTIFGESAGGRNVYSLLASPLAKGLFQRAISQSGSADTTLKTLAEDFPDNRDFNAVFGLENSSNSMIFMVLSEIYPSETKQQIRNRINSTDAAELLQILRNIDAKKLMQMASDNIDAPGYTRVARVIRDGYVIPKQSVLELLESPNTFNSVPLMLGTNRDEQKVFMARDPEYVDMLFGVLPRIKDVTRYNRVSKYVSDNWKAGAVDEPAKRVTNGSDQEVFAYRFDWDDSPVNWLVDLKEGLGASHGFEISFVFGDWEGGLPLDIIENKSNAQSRKELSLTMMDYWAAFAHYGDPGKGLSGTQPNWSKWQSQGNNLMQFDAVADGGSRMTELRHNVVDIKAKLVTDDVLDSLEDKCKAYAALFLHGYQASDFWSEKEYQELGCSAFPAGRFRVG